MRQKYLQQLSVEYLAFFFGITVLEVTEKFKIIFEVYLKFWGWDDKSVKIQQLKSKLEWKWLRQTAKNKVPDNNLSSSW